MHVYTRPFESPLEAALRVPGTGCHLLQIPKRVRDDGIQGVELFFGDGGVLVVGGAGFVYVVFGPELAGVHAGAVLGYFVPGGLVFYHP